MRYLFLVLLMAASVGVSAQTIGWNSFGKITKIYTKPSREGVYFVHEDMNDGACIGESSAYYFLDGSEGSKLFKETYSLLLAAYASGKSVRLYLNGCQATYQYPLIGEVEVN